MQRSVTDLLGGSLKPNDPRRFLVEAMVGAMTADGKTDARETAAIQQQIQTHPLLRGMPPSASAMLVDLSTDAIRYAGSSIARVSAIAKGLPARIHRTAAYGMAAEISAADQHLDDGELKFLEALRIALRISPTEARQIVAYAQKGQLDSFLQDRYLRLKTLIPIASEVFALRALARACATDEHRFAVRDFFAALPDLALTKDELDAELYRCFRRPRARDAQVFGELSRVAELMIDPVDRYWMVVYALVAEPPASIAQWRVIPFVGVLQAAFQITDTDMELAVVDALAFPSTMPRPI